MKSDAQLNSNPSAKDAVGAVLEAVRAELMAQFGANRADQILRKTRRQVGTIAKSSFSIEPQVARDLFSGKKIKIEENTAMKIQAVVYSDSIRIGYDLIDLSEARSIVADADGSELYHRPDQKGISDPFDNHPEAVGGRIHVKELVKGIEAWDERFQAIERHFVEHSRGEWKPGDCVYVCWAEDWDRHRDTDGKEEFVSGGISHWNNSDIANKMFTTIEEAMDFLLGMVQNLMSRGYAIKMDMLGSFNAEYTQSGELDYLR